MDILNSILSFIVDLAIKYGTKLIAAIIILAVGFKLAKWLTNTIINGRAIRSIDESVRSFLKSLLNISFKILVVISALAVMDVPLTSFVTMLASAGLAVGIALQGGLSNFAGGFMILIFKPFKVGDYIDAGAFSGTVRSITVFYTILLTPDNKTITLPNGNLTNQAIVNYSNEDTRRVGLTFNVALSNDVDKVKELLYSAAASEPMVLSEPAPFVGLSSQSATALEITMQVWCKAEDHSKVFFALNEAAKKAFADNGIAPFAAK